MKRHLLSGVFLLSFLLSAPASEVTPRLKPFGRGTWHEILHSHAGRAVREKGHASVSPARTPAGVTDVSAPTTDYECSNGRRFRVITPEGLLRRG